MILSDFLSRQKHDSSNPHEIIPISLNTYNALYQMYYRIEPQDRYQVQTQSHMKVTGVLLEKQKPQIQTKQVVKNRPKLGRGRAGIRCKKPKLLLI